MLLALRIADRQSHVEHRFRDVILDQVFKCAGAPVNFGMFCTINLSVAKHIVHRPAPLAPCWVISRTVCARGIEDRAGH